MLKIENNGTAILASQVAATIALPPLSELLMASLTGTLANNLLWSTNDVSDIINGLSGIDTVSYALARSAVNVSLSISGSQNTGGSGFDTLISIENITGSDFSDTLQGNSGNNVLDGGLGSDFVSYTSSAGSVTIDLQGGVVTGAAGLDTLISIENALGSRFSDRIFGSSINNIFAAGDGDDVIVASLGADYIDGGYGKDTVDYSALSGPITLRVSAGVVAKFSGDADSLFGVEVIIGTNTNQDTIDLSLAAASTATNTMIDLSRSSLNLQVNGGSGSAINLSVQQFENVIGSSIADVIIANSNSNNLSGNAGNDVIQAGFGWDTIAGGLGNDTLTGGADNDSFVFGEIGGTNADLITDFSAVQDTILLKNSLDSTLIGAQSSGVKGLSFAGSSASANVLGSAYFFKGAGFTGAGAGMASGIYVDTDYGNIYYNDSSLAGSYILANVGAAAAVTLTNADFVYAA